MLVGKVVKKKFAISLKFISFMAWPTVMRFTSSRFTRGSQIADKMAATNAAVAPWAPAAKTLLKKLAPAATALVATTDSSRGRVPKAHVLLPEVVKVAAAPCCTERGTCGAAKVQLAQHSEHTRPATKSGDARVRR